MVKKERTHLVFELESFVVGRERDLMGDSGNFPKAFCCGTAA
jgi:hypothetical protein